MSGFSVAWLDLREGADFTARDKSLALRALEWMKTDAGAIPLIVDLGSGTGSTLRALTVLAGHDPEDNIVWRLVDHDPSLLNEALRRHGRTHIIEDYEADLLAVDSLPLTGARLVSASALFDLVSSDVVDRLAARLTQQHTGFYAALNYDGRMQWTPGHPLDEPVRRAFNQDQRRDKGLGPALGPESGTYLQDRFLKHDYTVQVADSPWVLASADSVMVRELIGGIAFAVRHGHGLDADAVQQWQDFRLAHSTTGTCLIGHVDVLALPPSS